jgi:radical SAM protein with 4Fe4S-binding SPASM domain
VIVRFEPWGAWVKLEREAAVVALDRDGVRALGLDPTWPDERTHTTRPLEVHVAVTSRCAAGCEGCYLDARPDGVHPPRAELEARFDALARAGVFMVAFGGGEPTLRDDLGDLADAARARGLTPVVTTSGLGLGERKIEQLTRFEQVNVSFDGSPEAYEAVRGFDGAAAAESAIVRLARAGVKVGVNVVLTRATFDRAPETLRRAYELGAREAQLLRYKPAGRAMNVDYLTKRLRPEQARSLPSLLRTMSADLPELRIRIDCALVPFLSADPDLAARPEELTRWGVFGCEAGAHLAATRVDGTVLPCSFAGPTSITAADVAGDGWRDDPLLRSFRAYPEAPPEPCASCSIRAVCRGGCKVVSQFALAGEGFRPDPECPRVRAFATSDREA